LFKLFIFAKQMKNKKITIIGSGFSGFRYLKVDMMLQYSKNDAIGGRARLKKDGFTLIWDQVGTGCQTFSLLILEKNYRLL
jgi:hypothetical protein